MSCRKFVFLCLVACCSPFIICANGSVDIVITENTNPQIAELYQQIQDLQNEVDTIQSEHLGKLSENYQAVKENEQSTANKLLTGLTTAATGIGTMEALRGLSEQQADKNADADMDAYIATMRCSYADGKSVKAGSEPIELPGGNDEDLMKYRNEYIALATSLKTRKESLGMKPGLESELILDKADMGFYDQENVGITEGKYSSLYRAKMQNSETDKTEIEEESQKSAKRLKYGAIAAGAGVAGGIIGNAIINKDAPKNQSKEINREYDKKLAEATKKQENLTNQLNQAIAENAKQVKEYNEKLQQYKDQITIIGNAPKGCQAHFSEYISDISALQPIENETDSVPETEWPDISAQQTLLVQCIQCDKKGGLFEPETLACPCPAEKPVDKGDVCAEKEPEIETPPPAEIVTDPDDKGVVEEEKVEEEKKEEEKVEEEKKEEEPPTDDPAICAVGLKHVAGFGIEPGVTRVGDLCTSSLVLHGVIYKKNGICGCSAKICEPRNGRVAKGGACVCNEELGWKTDKKTKKCVCDGTNVEGRCSLANDKSAVTDKREYKFYNCCGNKNQIPDGIVCTCIEQFDGYKVTPMEAYGLITEFLLHKKKTAQKNLAKMYDSEVKCDDRPHNGGDRFMQCVSTKNDKLYYDFKFKSLDEGNKGFYGAMCSIYGLKSGQNSCKDATEAQCKEISDAVNRTFFPGGNAKMKSSGLYLGSRAISKSSECKVEEHPVTESAPIAFLNTKVLTKDDVRTVGAINPLHFYDKKLQVSASSDVYVSIQNYLFNELHIGLKTFDCGAGFVKNVPYYDVSRKEYNDTQEKIRKCQQDSQAFSGGGEHAAQSMGGAMSGCNRQYPLNMMPGDLLTCEYGDQKIDFLFKSLNVRWDRKSMGGYQGLKCLDAGGTFAGKTCALADKNQCLKFKEIFEKQYPDSKGIEWDNDIGCVLKDARMAARVQKVAETTGMVALTLATAVSGGPIMWVFTAVESTALVTEAVTENALSNWSNKFLADAAQCKTSNCANTVLKRHIARIMEGSKYFDETQNKAIAKQTERLCGMLDEQTLDAIVEKGVSAGHIGENRDPDLEKAIRAYYGTQLTGEEKALLTTKKVATVATFATLIAGGIMAGMRQAFKHNLIHIKKAKQARWVDLKILKVSDVTDDVVAMSKTGQKAAAKAGKTAPAAGKIDDIASGAGKSWEEELAEIGVKEEKTASGTVRYKDTKTGKYISKDEVLKRIDDMPGKTATPKPVEASPSPKPKDSAPKGKSVEEIEKSLGDRYNNVKPELKNNPDRTAVFQKNYLTNTEWETLNKSLAKDNLEVVPSGNVMIMRQKRVYPDAISDIRNRVYSEFNAHANKIKKGTEKELHIPKEHLSDREWQVLEADLKKEGLEISEANSHYYTVKKASTVNGAPASSTPKPGEMKPTTTPKPAETKPVSTPAAPKRTPAQEEAQWRALYEKYAPENQTFDKFKESFGNNLDEVKEYSRAWEEKAIIDKGAHERYQKQLADFRKKYGSDDAYYAYVRARVEAEEEAERLGKAYKMPDENTPILKSYTKEQIEDAKNIYQDARTDAVSASAGTPDDFYSTWDPNISKLKRELQGNNVSGYTKELNDYINKQNINLTREEADNIGAYIRGKKYDKRILSSAFSKDSGLNTMTEQAKNKYQELLLTQKSKNVRKIDDAAGLHAGSQSDVIKDINTTDGKNIFAKNEFVQNFVSKRVSMYEDIITKNPSIYNRAKRWKQLSIEEREKLCKEIFEIADTKLGVEHTEFAVKDLVAMGEGPATRGLQIGGNVYLSNRHFPDMSFEDVMRTISHEQAHKVDHLNPNKGILGSQLADLGEKEGYIQGYNGHLYADYRLELTEQSSWMIGDAMKKAISKLGL